MAHFWTQIVREPGSAPHANQHHRPSWKTAKAVELVTLTRVDWFNHRRLLGPIGHVAPAEAEAAYYEHHTMLPSAA